MAPPLQPTVLASPLSAQQDNFSQEVHKPSPPQQLVLTSPSRHQQTQGSGDAITNGKTAVVDYVGSLIDGTVFDASKRHGNGGFSFQLGAGQVIKGWDQGVLGMKVGEVRVLTIPADLAYGAQGIPGVIPPNATLTFEVTLLAIK
jgi:FKBP-type peptidyl-prolyl cis-trans isomerase